MSSFKCCCGLIDLCCSCFISRLVLQILFKQLKFKLKFADFSWLLAENWIWAFCLSCVWHSCVFMFGTVFTLHTEKQRVEISADFQTKVRFKVFLFCMCFVTSPVCKWDLHVYMFSSRWMFLVQLVPFFSSWIYSSNFNCQNILTLTVRFCVFSFLFFVDKTKHVKQRWCCFGSAVSLWFGSTVSMCSLSAVIRFFFLLKNVSCIFHISTGSSLRCNFRWSGCAVGLQPHLCFFFSHFLTEPSDFSVTVTVTVASFCPELVFVCFCSSYFSFRLIPICWFYTFDLTWGASSNNVKLADFFPPTSEPKSDWRCVQCRSLSPPSFLQFFIISQYKWDLLFFVSYLKAVELSGWMFFCCWNFSRKFADFPFFF